MAVTAGLVLWIQQYSDQLKKQNTFVVGVGHAGTGVVKHCWGPNSRHARAATACRAAQLIPTVTSAELAQRNGLNGGNCQWVMQDWLH